jgi:hypothetical protein
VVLAFVRLCFSYLYGLKPFVDLTASILAVHKDMRSINASASICKPRTGSNRAANEAHHTDKLTDPRPAAEAEAEMEFATQGETAMGEETLFVDGMPTAADAGKRRRYREFELDELASADTSATGDETISNDQVFQDAASYKSLGDDLYDVGRILGEKQGDGRTFYMICGTVTVKMNLHGSRRRI